MQHKFCCHFSTPISSAEALQYTQTQAHVYMLSAFSCLCVVTDFVTFRQAIDWFWIVCWLLRSLKLCKNHIKLYCIVLRVRFTHKTAGRRHIVDMNVMLHSAHVREYIGRYSHPWRKRRANGEQQEERTGEAEWKKKENQGEREREVKKNTKISQLFKPAFYLPEGSNMADVGRNGREGVATLAICLIETSPSQEFTAHACAYVRACVCMYGISV